MRRKRHQKNQVLGYKKKLVEALKAQEVEDEEFFQQVVKLIRIYFNDEWEFNDRYIYLSFEPGNNGRMYSRLSPHCEGRLLAFKNKLFEGSYSEERKSRLRKFWLYAIKLYTVAVLDGRRLDSKAVYNGTLLVITGWNKSYLYPKKGKGMMTLDDMEDEFLNNFHDESRTGVPGLPEVVQLPFDLEEDDGYFSAFPRGVPGFALLTYEEKAGIDMVNKKNGTLEEDQMKQKEYDVINGIFKSVQSPAMVRGKTKKQWKEEESIFREYCAIAHHGIHGFRIDRVPLEVGFDD